MTSNRFDMISEKFKFIYDDVFLIAEVNKSTGKQWLVMQKVDPRTNYILLEDRIQCIHTAITTMELEEFEERVTEEDFDEKILNLRSSENAKEVHLEIDDKFFALKSWVAGIVEAGVNAITIQSDIERFAHLHHPIGNRLFNFLLKAKPLFIIDFLKKIERECVFEGEYHEPSVNANLMKVLEVIVLEEREAWNHWRDQVTNNYEWHEEWKLYTIKNFDKLIETIFKLQPSANIFLEKNKFNFMLTLPEAKDLSDWDEVTHGSVMYNNLFHFCYNDKETKLVAIDLHNLKIPKLGNVHGLQDLSQLEQLHLEVNYLEKIEGMESFPNLKRLHINHNYIKKIENLNHLQNLEVLFLGYNEIEKIENLEKLTNLKELYIYSNKIKQIEGLETLTNLRVLNISWNQMEKITGLESLTNLKKLNIGGNKFTVIEGLEPLKKLVVLDLYSNQLTEYPDLSYLPNLKEINVYDNLFPAKR